ncbi:hypothetical protein PMZ80_001303 [Knufia obscura]|uniref:Large ribosomal subunit protein uL3m n=2 Tax=Knufia TaxID=430999 RepID=A0AAN8EHY6_9EURO|nr:hypothetical protein PMZ80_001303 [Knufia obscura]KAK5956294.1 hypothetical protein OHC33_002870 [Knufia fluminis]
MPPKATVLVAVPLPPSFLLPRTCLQPSKAATQQTRSFGIKSLEPPRVNPYNNGPGLPGLLSTQKAAYERKIKSDTLPLRTGALAIKRGMTAIYDSETGERVPCTVLQLERNQVVHHKTMKEHGYYAVCVGAGAKHPKNINKPELGHFSVQGVGPKRYLQEFRVRDEKGLLSVGESIHASWFMEGQYVDTRSDCKGKGFSGVMKRWGFGGQPRSHGHSLSHRSAGGTGNGQGGGSRVYPGKKMAGNMGGQRNTVQNLKVLQTDEEKGIVLVNGAVSGPKGCVVMIQDALLKPWPNVPPPPKPVEKNAELREAIGAKIGTSQNGL